MPSLDARARDLTALDAEDVAWLHRLLADWQLLADLSFADLVLWVPTRDRAGHVALAQMRPTTGPTVHHADLVGALVPWGRREQLDTALAQGLVTGGGGPTWRDDVPFREQAIPVVRGDRTIGVISQHTNLAAARTPSRLELTYLSSADDLAQMIAEGTFPVGHGGQALEVSPRVGDGLIRLEPAGEVSYASPNALSAYRRMGLSGDLVGSHLGQVTAALAPPAGPVEESVATLLSGRAPRSGVEVEGLGTVLQLRTIPLLAAGRRTGALVLLRDVSELRVRERELLSKDATIREIHHRVKNNLQTVAALLRLQARRLPEGEGRTALSEAVRRVGAIAVVHETLSLGDTHGLGDALDGDEVVARLLAAVAEVARDAASTGEGGRGAGGVTMRQTGHVGRLDAGVATPLALVLAELIQNALDHGFAAPEGVHPSSGGTAGTGPVLSVHAERRTTSAPSAAGAPAEDAPEAQWLRVTVTDNGRGLPAGFVLERSASLGLQIVNALVTSELGGALRLSGGAGGGVEAVLDVPLHRPAR